MSGRMVNPHQCSLYQILPSFKKEIRTTQSFIQRDEDQSK